MKTAFVYDWLVSLGGGERVLEALNKLYPSPIYTLVHDKSLFLDQCVHSSFIQGLPFSRKWYRYYLPFFPLAIEQFDLREYDVVLSLSHAVAKGALTHAHQLHLCYCFTPMRYAWDLYHAHMLELSRGKRNLCALLLHYLRSWDQSSVSRVDQFAAVSKYIARRIQKIYNRPATVIYPPVATHLFQGALPRENFYLTVSRLVPYKRIDLLVEAFSYMPDKQLIVIGEGPEEKKIKAKARKNVEFLGHQSDTEVRKYMMQAKAFLFAAEEDFGIVPVEAQAAGTPVIAFGRGGALETVLSEKTGLFFSEQTIASVVEAVSVFEKSQECFDAEAIKAHASQFGEERFTREFQQFVRAAYENHCFGRR